MYGFSCFFGAFIFPLAPRVLQGRRPGLGLNLGWTIGLSSWSISQFAFWSRLIDSLYHTLINVHTCSRAKCRLYCSPVASELCMRTSEVAPSRVLLYRRTSLPSIASSEPFVFSNSFIQQSPRKPSPLDKFLKLKILSKLRRLLRPLQNGPARLRYSRERALQNVFHHLHTPRFRDTNMI